MSEEERVDEYLHYISRSSTEFYLSGRYKSELYLTPNKLSDSDSDDDDGKKFIPERCFDTDSDPKFSPPPKLVLPPQEIESRIEEFLNNFKQNGWGLLGKDDLSLDCSSDAFLRGYNDSKQPNPSLKSRTYKRLQRPNSQLLRREGIMVVRGKNSEGKIRQNMLKSWHTNAGGSDLVTETRCIKNVVLDDIKQMKETKAAGESISDFCNFRVSWVSNESSTPSGPRQSLTSPSDNNFFSSSLTSSAMSQIEDELGDEQWSFDFPSDNLDYPDRRARLDPGEGGRRVSPASSHSRKFSCSSVSTSVFGGLSRGSRMPSLASTGVKAWLWISVP